jgi:hypothetical protein
VKGCAQRGPSVRFGEIAITLCMQHKAEFDASWQVAFDEVQLAG